MPLGVAAAACSSGSVILPIVAAVAAERAGHGGEDGAADDVGVQQAARAARSIHGARPLNMSSLSRVRKRISPIQMNSGRAVSVQLDDAVQMVVTIASPAGRLGEQLHADEADAEQGRPIQTPPPAAGTNRTNSSRPVEEGVVHTALLDMSARLLGTPRLASGRRAGRHEPVEQEPPPGGRRQAPSAAADPQGRRRPDPG